MITKTFRPVILLFFICLVLMQGVSVSSQFFNNVGLILFNRIPTDPLPFPLQNDVLLQRASQSQKFLNLALEASSKSSSARRILGYSWLTSTQKEVTHELWKDDPQIQSELLLWGNLASENEDYASASEWYQLSIEFFPEWGDAWYYLGLDLQTQGEWESALAAYNQAVEKELFLHPVISNAYFQQGDIFQWKIQDTAQALEFYDTAINLNNFDSDEVKADAFYKRGEIYSWRGETTKAIEEYQQSIRNNPFHTWAQLRLSYAQYTIDNNLELAEERLQVVIEAWTLTNNPNVVWAYWYLGEIYDDSGKTVQAIEAYQRVLHLNPNHIQAQQKLTALQNSTDE